MSADLAARVLDEASTALAAAPRGSAAAEADALLARRGEAETLLRRLADAAAGSLRTRVHGDFHLGQVLIVQNDVVFTDFEGEPGRPTASRRAKDSPLRDVAGMLRSFAYAAEIAQQSVAQRLGDRTPKAAALVRSWRDRASAAFLEAYESAAAAGPQWIADAAARQRVLRFHLLLRGLYEVLYEARNRPDWVGTPVRGVLEVLDLGLSA